MNNLPKLVNTSELVDIQNTAFTVDAVGRYLCSTWQEATQNGGPPFGAIVIGAGMYGGYLAESLSFCGIQEVVQGQPVERSVVREACCNGGCAVG